MSQIKVFKIKKGEVVAEYPSISQAASSNFVNESSIRRALNKPHRRVRSHHWTTMPPVSYNSRMPKILILDIETAPIAGFVWGLWKQNIHLSQIISDWFILTWAAKWLGEQEMFSGKLTSQEAIQQDDSRIMGDLWLLLDEADVVVCHYGDVFDIPKIKSRFLVHGFVPPSPYKQIDTKKIASKEFGFSSNKLQALAKLFGYEGKIETTMELWVGCMKGDANSLNKMELYNIQDIYVLENVYLYLRPYIKGHPNLDLYFDSETPRCPSCGQSALEPIENKFFYTQAVKYQVYRCTCCGSISRAKQGIKYVHKKKVSAIPR